MTTEPQDLSAASSVEQLSAGDFGLTVADGWQQGRGAFGGLVLAAMLRAVEASEPDETRTLRSLTAALCGPTLPGEARIAVQLVRAGSGVSTWTAQLRQQDEVRAQLTAVLGKTRAVEHQSIGAIERPEPGWAEVPIAPLGPPLTPVFTQHLEFRPTGPPPFSGASEARAAGWIRPRRSAPQLGMPELVALADAWWPAVLPLESKPRPIGTIAFTLQPLVQAPLPADVPLHHSAEVISAQDGFVVEQRTLRTPEGRCVALNQQTFVWIR